MEKRKNDDDFKRRGSVWRIIVGALLLAIGLIFLFANLGIISPDTVSNVIGGFFGSIGRLFGEFGQAIGMFFGSVGGLIGRFWPLILILIGATMLFTRRKSRA
jgi:uncharacterized integral membrane protein